MADESGDITRLLTAWSRGDAHAGNEVAPLVYRELRRRAAGYLRRERRDHTLQATALVHEAWMRLAAGDRVAWQGRAHFFAVASRAMRRILVDHARERHAAKRPAPALRVALEEETASTDPRDCGLLDLDQALDELADLDPRQAQIVEMRYFGGLSLEEAAEVLGLSVSTLKHDWTLAKAWLYRRITGEGPCAADLRRVRHDASR
jgi:RNA polymerase sigma-70 factor (ECF subfamily)